MLWARMLAYVTGSVNQELLLQNEYLTAENQILRSQIKGRLRLSDGEKATLAEIAHRLGREALKEVAAIGTPDSILAGIGSWSLASSMDRNFPEERVVPRSTQS